MAAEHIRLGERGTPQAARRALLTAALSPAACAMPRGRGAVHGRPGRAPSLATRPAAWVPRRPTERNAGRTCTRSSPAATSAASLLRWRPQSRAKCSRKKPCSVADFHSSFSAMPGYCRASQPPAYCGHRGVRRTLKGSCRSRQRLRGRPHAGHSTPFFCPNKAGGGRLIVGPCQPGPPAHTCDMAPMMMSRPRGASASTQTSNMSPPTAGVQASAAGQLGRGCACLQPASRPATAFSMHQESGPASFRVPHQHEGQPLPTTPPT